MKKQLQSVPEIPLVTHDDIQIIDILDLATCPFIISIYMRCNTKLCDIQLDSLNQMHSRIKDMGYELYAIGRDTRKKIFKIIEERSYTYGILSDPDYKFAKAMDMMVEKSMYGKKYFAPPRSTLFFSSKGVLQTYLTDIDVGNHGNEIISSIENLTIV